MGLTLADSKQRQGNELPQTSIYLQMFFFVFTKNSQKLLTDEEGAAPYFFRVERSPPLLESNMHAYCPHLYLYMERVETSVSSRAVRQLDAPEMHGLDTSNVSCRVET